MFGSVKKKSKVPLTILSDYIFLSFFLSSYTVYGVLPGTYSKWMFSIALLSIAYFFSDSLKRFYDSKVKEDCSLEDKKKTKRKVIVSIVFIIIFTVVQITMGWNQYKIPFRY